MPRGPNYEIDSTQTGICQQCCRVLSASVPPPASVTTVAATSGAVPTLAQAERDLILRALDIHGNDRAKAARALGLSSRTLYRRLKEYGIN